MTIKGAAGEQLKMFMSAREIRENYAVRPQEARLAQGGDIWKYKLSAADDPYGLWSVYSPEPPGIRTIAGDYRRSLSEDLRLRGVQRPVSLGDEERVTVRKPSGEQVKQGTIAGGYHRIAAMYRDNPDVLMPVVHHRNFDDAEGNWVFRYT